MIKFKAPKINQRISIHIDKNSNLCKIVFDFDINVLCLFIGLITTYPSCLTWEKEQHVLRFICRIDDISMPVTLFDTHGEKYADYFFNDEFYNRRSMQSNGYQANIKKIIFTVDLLQTPNVDGKWRCCQGDKIFQTEVAVSSGQLIFTNFIQIMCLSQVRSLIKNCFTLHLNLFR